MVNELSDDALDAVSGGTDIELESPENFSNDLVLNAPQSSGSSIVLNSPQKPVSSIALKPEH